MSVFYDSHLHCTGTECGGFIIGTEGEPSCKNCVTNDQAEQLSKTNSAYCSVKYVGRLKMFSPDSSGSYLKYHPKREKYSPSEVIKSIRLFKPKLVIIDTLNEPEWGSMDYWNVARECCNAQFVMAHAGGYSLYDFIKMCHLQENIWIDFALTHTYFGGISKNPLPYVDDAIGFALKAKPKSKILLGSDNPFFCQADIVQYYESRSDEYIPLMNENYLRLLDLIRNE